MHAIILGLLLVGWSILNMNSACWRRSSHQCFGKWESLNDRLAIKWCLAVWITLSAAFAWWQCGATFWYAAWSVLVMTLKTCTDVSLSIMLILGLFLLCPVFIHLLVHSKHLVVILALQKIHEYSIGISGVEYKYGFVSMDKCL